MERDSLGVVAVAGDRLWGAQTERARENFQIGDERMPMAIVRALAEVKRACARVNAELGLLPRARADAIVAAAEEILAGRHDAEFPLVVWQTGSGTQSNMNVNEVIANRASELLGGPRGEGRLVHPNDDVNRGQSSNDVFPTAMHLAAVAALTGALLPALRRLADALAGKAGELADVVKIGRTHLMDATPLTLGQELSGHAALVAHGIADVERALPSLHALAIGGTAVGTGLGAPAGFGARVAAELARATGHPFVSAANKFAELSAHAALLTGHGALRSLAASLAKIAADLRLLASGPRSGLGELRLPENEPGSSIMPGKVNPTQCEAMTMVCTQVLGNDTALAVAGASGNFELNVYKPLIAHAVLQSVRLLGDACASFDEHCARGIEPNRAEIAKKLHGSLMLVTALAPHVGYDNAAKIAKRAHHDGTTLKEAAAALNLVTPEDFDRWVIPEAMTRPH